MKFLTPETRAAIFEIIGGIPDEISALVEALDNLQAAGTWTPAISRATIDSASGNYYRIGSIVYCTATITFGTSQTDQGDMFIDGTSLPIQTGSMLGALGIGDLSSVGTVNGNAAFGNRNVWLTLAGNRIKANRTGIPGSTLTMVIIYSI